MCDIEKSLDWVSRRWNQLIGGRWPQRREESRRVGRQSARRVFLAEWVVEGGELQAGRCVLLVICDTASERTLASVAGVMSLALRRAAEQIKADKGEE